jgi:hypothetical protein
VAEKAGFVFPRVGTEFLSPADAEMTSSLLRTLFPPEFSRLASGRELGRALCC